MNALTLVYIALGLLVAFTIEASDMGRNVLEAWAGLFCDDVPEKKRRTPGTDEPWNVEESCVDRVKGASQNASSIAISLLVLFVVAKLFAFVE